MQTVRRGLLIVWSMALLALALGFAGAVHPAGDSLAVFRPFILIGLLALTVLVLITGPRRLGFAGLAILAAAGATLIPPPLASFAPGKALVVYQKNLLFLQPDLSQVVADIQDTDADIVFLQEMHARNRPILELLQESHPYAHLCPFAAVGGVAVVSRFPIRQVDAICIAKTGIALVPIEAPSKTFWAASVHLNWPWPHRQPEDVARIGAALKDLDGPIVMGGDFNMVPWSYAMRALRRASGTTHAGYPGGTYDFLHPVLPLAIDHVLMPEGAALVSVETRPKLGSDHRGVLAKFVMP